MSPRKYLTVQPGQRFGRLTVLGETRISSRRKAAACSCDCGAGKTVALSNLYGGNVQSCGCLREEMRQGNEYARTHGLSKHPLYETWRDMNRRCQRDEDYHSRGISVCERWRDPAAFLADIERDLGPRPGGAYPSGVPLYSLDRIDNNGNYEPGNVRWATASEQQLNTRRTRRPLSPGSSVTGAENPGRRRTIAPFRLSLVVAVYDHDQVC